MIARSLVIVAQNPCQRRSIVPSVSTEKEESTPEPL